jgi:hypothetical protein
MVLSMRNLDDLVQKIKVMATYEQVDLLGALISPPVDDLCEMTAPLTERDTALMQDIMLSFRDPDPVVMTRGARNRHERRALVSRRRKGY